MANIGAETGGSSAPIQLSDNNTAGHIFGQSIADLISFYGATPLAQQANTVDAITQLVNLGLLASGSAIQGNATPPVSITTGQTLTSANAGKLLVLNNAAGMALVLPAATGSGVTFQFEVGTTVTSVGITITTGITGASSDAYQGYALTEDGGTMTGWVATPGAGGSDVITLNGTTTGGFVGDFVEVQDAASGRWAIKRFVTKSTGTAATPFSHT
jgi:hypothetical protein